MSSTVTTCRKGDNAPSSVDDPAVAGDTASAPAGPSSLAAPAVTSPSYTFSAEAAPFIPSFMRGTAALPPSTTASAATASPSTANNCPAAAVTVPDPRQPQALVEDAAQGEGEENEDEEEDVEPSREGSEDNNYRQHFSKMWMLCLEQMQGSEVGMLMDMLPLDIQDLYFDKLSDEYLHHDHEHKDKGVHALCAAQKMVQELSPEQLAYIEEFLIETDALNPEAKRRRHSAHLPHRGMNADPADGGNGGAYGGFAMGVGMDVYDEGDDEEENLFMHDDDGMGVEEEEWLLEQMMVAGGHADEVAAVKKRK